jgi:outer membrane scaffolding protein for murein synthesis (MipA/OmpV family)
MSSKNISACQTMSVTILMIFCITGLCGLPGIAQEHDEGGRNWELMLGGGSFYTSEYTGADEMKFEPIPLVIGCYDTDRFTLFVEGDHAGAGLKFGESIPWSLSAGVGLGAGRDHDDLDIFEGTPTLENSVRLLGELAFELPMATLATTVNFFPIAAEYEEAARSDKDYSGVLVDVDVSREWMRMPFMMRLSGGFSWMNRDYAEAHYGVAYPTAHLETFKPGNGMHSLNLSADIVMFFHKHLGAMLLTEGK